jgi:hypothetical protein
MKRRRHGALRSKVTACHPLHGELSILERRQERPAGVATTSSLPTLARSRRDPADGGTRPAGWRCKPAPGVRGWCLVLAWCRAWRCCLALAGAGCARAATARVALAAAAAARSVEPDGPPGGCGIARGRRKTYPPIRTRNDPMVRPTEPGNQSSPEGSGHRQNEPKRANRYGSVLWPYSPVR